MSETKFVVVVTVLMMVGIAVGFWLGYNAGQSDVIAACVKNAEFQRGDDYILCEIED